MFLGPHKMKMSHYFSVFDTLWNLGLFLFLKTPPLILNYSQLKLGTFLIFWRPPPLNAKFPSFVAFSIGKLPLECDIENILNDNFHRFVFDFQTNLWIFITLLWWDASREAESWPNFPLAKQNEEIEEEINDGDLVRTSWWPSICLLMWKVE